MIPAVSGPEPRDDAQHPRRRDVRCRPALLLLGGAVHLRRLRSSSFRGPLACRLVAARWIRSMTAGLSRTRQAGGGVGRDPPWGNRGAQSGVRPEATIALRARARRRRAGAPRRSRVRRVLLPHEQPSACRDADTAGRREEPAGTCAGSWCSAIGFTPGTRYVDNAESFATVPRLARERLA